jgi:hypothetical protein
MLKKLLIGLASLLAIAAFAVMPVAAQAEIQHWYRGGANLAEGTTIPIVMFGGKINLSQNNAVGEVNCRTVAGGTIENPVDSGLASVGPTRSTSTNARHRRAKQKSSKPPEWKGGVKSRSRTTRRRRKNRRSPVGATYSTKAKSQALASSVREKIGEPFETFKTPSPPGMIRETYSCEVAATKQVIESFIVEGELKPEIGLAKSGNLNGSAAAKPSVIKFEGAWTGALHSAVAGENTAKGSLKYLGYFEQELITVKP